MGFSIETSIYSVEEFLVLTGATFIPDGLHLKEWPSDKMPVVCFGGGDSMKAEIAFDRAEFTRLTSEPNDLGPMQICLIQVRDLLADGSEDFRQFVRDNDLVPGFVTV